jgi:Flp pilus assembly CpaF family ATPase
MASQNVEAIITCNDHSAFYVEQDHVNTLVARMEAITKDVDMGDLFRKFIKCAKDKNIVQEDFSKLSDTITMVKEKLKDYRELVYTIAQVKKLLGTV